MNIQTSTYETLLPFVVVEALSKAVWPFSSLSVRMMDRGWAWLVSGRRLLIWKFKEDADKSRRPTNKARRTLSPNFELQLPHSGLIHKADLINVFFIPRDPNTSQRIINVPAALAVSPEGTIRFWSNITNEKPSESSVSEQQGQEFCTLAALSPLEYLLGTTTGSIYQLTLDITATDPKNVIVCTMLAVPTGLLSGIKRMSSLFFGPTSAEISSETRRPLIASMKPASENEARIDKTFFVMGSSLKLRQWSRTNEAVNSQNQLVREWDLEKNVHRKLATALRISNLQNLNYWPVDMITTKTKELLILIVTLDTTRDNTINYATCVFNPFQAADKIGKTTILRSHSWRYSNESEEQLLAIRFLERRATSPLCFMYDRKILFLAQMDRDILDAVDYANQGDGILGAGFIDGQAVLFTQSQGLICVQPVVSDRSRFDVGNETTMYQDSSRLVNETRIEQPSRAESSIHQQSTRAEPMLVEINDDDDDAVNQENSRVKAPNQSRQKVEKDHSTLTRSNLDTSSLNKSLDTSRQRADDVNDFMKNNKEFEWVQHIDSKHYRLAGETLAKLAEESELMKDRKETLLALSKLALLAE